MGRFSVTFKEVLIMMHKKKPQWFHMYDEEENMLNSEVYIGIEFINPNKMNNKPIFTLKNPKDLYYLHLLTIGTFN